MAEANLKKLRKIPMVSLADDRDKAFAMGCKIRKKALKILGLSRRPDWGYVLFKIEHWPGRLYSAYKEHEGNRKLQARIVCKAIDWFIDKFKKEGHNVRPSERIYED